MDNIDDDKDRSLHELSVQHQASIVSQLVELGSRTNQEPHKKSLPFIEELECLQAVGTHLFRTSINAFEEEKYIALSYTWGPSVNEDPEPGRYSVEDWVPGHLSPSQVRNCVLDRVLAYMRHFKVRLLWIDRHCIRQDRCDAAICNRHTSCRQQRDALQAMDLVYELSAHPVALLGRPLRVESELYLLARILRGDLVNRSKVQLSRAVSIDEARKALWLVHEITRDAWWTRAWTFQENYRGGEQMRLLIAHDPALEQQKLGLEIDSEMPGQLAGELCMPSDSFSKQATLLCLALEKVVAERSQDKARIKKVLRATGNYELYLRESSPMTPTVVDDIATRGLTKPWDRLAIVANCCQYSVRLDGQALSKQNGSLSLSLLAMCLLNGEILNNDDRSLGPAESLTTSKFLGQFSYNTFRAPADNDRPLIYNQGCRLIDVELKEEGILTKGHLWKLSKIIDTSSFSQGPWDRKSGDGRMGIENRKSLSQLEFWLRRDDGKRRKRRKCGKYELACQIQDYLEYDAGANEGQTSANFVDEHLFSMATEVARAIQTGQKLRLGCIWDPKHSSPYSAVFVWSHEGDHDGEVEELDHPFVFTSAWFSDPGDDNHDSNDIDRHVSLEVDFNERAHMKSEPHLHTRKWRLGMCFFQGCKRSKVIFPWPRALRAVEPSQ